MCAPLNIHVEAASMTLYDVLNPREIGTPEDFRHVSGDGNYFFRAISFVLTGSEDKLTETYC